VAVNRGQKTTVAVQNRSCWGEIRKTDRSMCRPLHTHARARTHTHTHTHTRGKIIEQWKSFWAN